VNGIKLFASKRHKPAARIHTHHDGRRTHWPFLTSHSWPVEPYLRTPSASPTALDAGGQSGVCSSLKFLCIVRKAFNLVSQYPFAFIAD
jgi:hypothetical protein